MVERVQRQRKLAVKRRVFLFIWAGLFAYLSYQGTEAQSPNTTGEMIITISSEESTKTK
jgi:hypothetical protein